MASFISRIFRGGGLGWAVYGQSAAICSGLRQTRQPQFGHQNLFHPIWPHCVQVFCKSFLMGRVSNFPLFYFKLLYTMRFCALNLILHAFLYFLLLLSCFIGGPLFSRSSPVSAVMASRSAFVLRPGPVGARMGFRGPEGSILNEGVLKDLDGVGGWIVWIYRKRGDTASVTMLDSQGVTALH